MSQASRIAGAVSNASANSDCSVDFPELARRAEHKTISYAETIAPMLNENCVSCHREGGVAVHLRPVAINYGTREGGEGGFTLNVRGMPAFLAERVLPKRAFAASSASRCSVIRFAMSGVVR